MSPELQMQVYLGIGILLILAEIIVPAFGLLALIGIVVFILGVNILNAHPELQAGLFEPSLVWGAGVLALLITGLFFFYFQKSLKGPNTSGQESLIGETAQIIEWSGKKGKVRIQGEMWQAVSDEPENFTPDQHVEITGAKKLTLTVKKTIEF
ncbi:MAG: NfeD family protein [Pseudobdellovibrionaceae bacterium]